MQICKSTGDEETEDVVVDGDDTATFGASQFHENDIQSAVAASETSSTTDEGAGDVKMSTSFTLRESDSKDHIISALKQRVHELEEMNKEAKLKNRCLICLVVLLLFFNFQVKKFI